MEVAFMGITFMETTFIEITFIETTFIEDYLFGKRQYQYPLINGLKGSKRIFLYWIQI